MSWRTILATLWRHPLRAGVLTMQIALTFAIAANLWPIVHEQWHAAARPSGLDEAGLWVVKSWRGQDSLIAPADEIRDLHVLRELPEVRSASRLNFVPLENAGWRKKFCDLRSSCSGDESFLVGFYFTDESALTTLGLKLVQGRFFRSDEVINWDDINDFPAVAVVTKAFADAAFPGESALGQRLKRTAPDSGGIRIIGVVEAMQSAWPQSQNHELNILMPARITWGYAHYLVRATSGARLANALIQADPRRVVEYVKPFADIRQDAYRPQIHMIVFSLVLCCGLVVMVAVGIYAAARQWVATRRRQLGIQRALGATARDVIFHVCIENGLLAAGGLLLGLPLAGAGAKYLGQHFTAAGMSVAGIAVPAIVVLLVTQLAALRVGLQAAAVPPKVAAEIQARGVWPEF